MMSYNTINREEIILTEGNEMNSTCGISDEELFKVVLINVN